MKRLAGPNERLENIHGQGGQHRTGKALTRAIALGDLADTQYASAEDATKRYHATVKLLRAAYKSDAILLEDEEHKQVSEMVEAAFSPPAMERHSYQQGALVQLRDWLKTATEVEVATSSGRSCDPQGEQQPA